MVTSGRTALIVEDDPALLGLLCEILEDAGFTVTSHQLGRPAIKALWQQRFDLMVVDVNLPDMNGLTLCDVAREQHGGSVAVLMITGFKIKDLRVTALQVGADDFLPTPFDLDDLLVQIAAKLRRLAGA